MDGAEGSEGDSRESGATGLELTTSSISRVVVFCRVEGPGALGSRPTSSISYCVLIFMLTDGSLGVNTYGVQNNFPPVRKRLRFPFLLRL